MRITSNTFPSCAATKTNPKHSTPKAIARNLDTLVARLSFMLRPQKGKTKSSRQIAASEFNPLDTVLKRERADWRNAGQALQHLPQCTAENARYKKSWNPRNVAQSVHDKQRKKLVRLIYKLYKEIICVTSSKSCCANLGGEWVAVCVLSEDDHATVTAD